MLMWIIELFVNPFIKSVHRLPFTFFFLTEKNIFNLLGKTRNAHGTILCGL